jgi:hypothetical protein
MARPWRMAKTLDTLLAEVNASAPKRDKRSDGGIGDAAHATRTSDHNPWIVNGAYGVVSARDFTDDPANGFDAHAFADWLRQQAKANKVGGRVKYIISQRRIASAIDNWAWRAYTGINPHISHVHVSVESAVSKYDSTAPWGWYPKPKAPAKPKPAKASMPTLEGKVTLLGSGAAELGRKPGEVISLRYILNWGKDKL